MTTFEDFTIEGTTGSIAVRRLRSPACKQQGQILFVHGAWSSTWYWERHFMPFFAEAGYDCHALNLRGHGSSDGNIRLGTVEAYCNDVSLVLQQMASPVLVGHSMGGLIAQHVAARHALSGLILLASVPHYGCWTGLAATMKANPLTVLKCMMTMDLSPVVEDAETARQLLLSRGPLDTQLDYVLDLCGPESLLALMGMLFKPAPKRPDPHMPRLVIGAQEDGFISVADVTRTAHRLDTDPVIVPRTSHMLMIDEKWRAVAEIMLRWLRVPATEHHILAPIKSAG